MRTKWYMDGRQQVAMHAMIKDYCATIRQMMHDYEETGTSFCKYLTNRRMDYAKEFLITTDKSVGDIAVLVGFSSANYFTRLFKSTEGVIPSAFREKMVRQSDARLH